MAKLQQPWLFFIFFLQTMLFYLSYADIGSAAHYSPPYIPTACFGSDTSEFPKSNLFAAAGEAMWEDGANCGQQHLVRCLSAATPGTCNDQTIKIMIVDRAYTSVSKPSADNVTMVLSTIAFKSIANGSAASVSIEFKRIGSWRLESIGDWISKEEKEAIMEIQLCREKFEDCLIWPYKNSGEYEVRSGYYVKKNEEIRGRGDVASSSYSVNSKIWRSDVPSKLKVFMWRVVSNALTTKENLWKKRCLKDPICDLCGKQEETVEHMLLCCEWNAGVWFAGCFGMKIEAEKVKTMDQWLMGVIENIDTCKEDKERVKRRIIYTCWGIWKTRCERLLGNRDTNIAFVVKKVIEAESEYGNLTVNAGKEEKKEETGKREGEGGWEKPEKGWLKVHCDGAFCQKTKEAGFGVIVGDEDGRVVAGKGGRFRAGAAVIAEAVACREGAKIA